MFTRAGRLEAALKMRDQALGVFVEAKERLNAAVIKIQNHITESQQVLADLHERAEAEKALIDQNRQHIDSAVKTIVKINEILN